LSQTQSQSVAHPAKSLAVAMLPARAKEFLKAGFRHANFRLNFPEVCIACAVLETAAAQGK
jgi:hypothetical protein